MLDSTKGCKGGPQRYRDNSDGACCIDTYRIYDSCKNQDCMEDLRVLVTDEGQRILDGASAVRVKAVKILWTQIHTEEMPFNKGYFQIHSRFYVHTLLDCCTGLGTGQDVAGLCVFDQSVLLYGGEGNVSVFKSDIQPDSFCPTAPVRIQQSTNLPRAVVEVAEPVALRLNVVSYDPASTFGVCVCGACQIPDNVSRNFEGMFRESSPGCKVCYLSLGIFSICRLERPAQLVVPACDDCIPTGSGCYDLPKTDPCALFRSMDFPLGEFYPEMHPCETEARKNTCCGDGEH